MRTVRSSSSMRPGRAQAAVRAQSPFTTTQPTQSADTTLMPTGSTTGSCGLRLNSRRKSEILTVLLVLWMLSTGMSGAAIAAALTPIEPILDEHFHAMHADERGTGPEPKLLLYRAQYLEKKL